MGVLILVLVLLLCVGQGVGQSESMTATLSGLRSSSPSGVIRLNDTLLRGILSLPSPRAFHFVVFFDARKLHSRSELALPSLKSEFSLVSSSFLINTNNNKSQSQSMLLFFFDIEVEESQASFAFFGVSTLPHVRLIPSTAADPKTGSLKVDVSRFSALGDAVVELIEAETSVSVGPIKRPPLLSKAQTIAAMGVAVVISRKSMAVLQKKSTWMAGAMAVYFFSVSGTMYNIIRKAPMFIEDRRDREKLVFFYKGAGAQLGAEGLAVGFLYTTVGVLMAFVCHVLVRVRDAKWQRLGMLLVLLLCFWAVKEVVKWNNWKTGYHIRAYWPSSTTH